METIVRRKGIICIRSGGYRFWIRFTNGQRFTSLKFSTLETAQYELGIKLAELETVAGS